MSMQPSRRDRNSTLPGVVSPSDVTLFQNNDPQAFNYHPFHSSQERSTSSSNPKHQFYSKSNSLFVTLCFLILLGLRPKRLQAQLETDDPKVWNEFRDGLIKRWGTLGITSGLVLSATTTMLFSDRVYGGALVAAFASLCASIVSITFGTALTFIFTDAPARDFKTLASRPMHMVFLLSIPNMFAMGAMVALYVAITIFAWSSGTGIPTLLAKMGTTAGAVIMVMLFAYAAWLVRDMGKHGDASKETKEWRDPANLS